VDFLKDIIAKMAPALGFILSAFAVYENYSIETEKFTIASQKIPKPFDGFKILHLSDFHNKNFGFKNKYLYDEIHKLNPDVILMTGDMVSREDKDFSRFYALARETAAKYPVYYTVGNHELDLSDEELTEMFQTLRGYGVNILNNEKILIEREDETIELYGMWFGLRFYKDENGSYRKHIEFDRDEMTRLLGRKTSKNYAIMMAHNPMPFKIYADWGADLVFSGHVHGGVIRLGKLGGLLSPGRCFFPKYYGGEYSIGDKKMIVSRGIGGLRLFNRPNLVLAELKAL
jgi:hypothetical protein